MGEIISLDERRARRADRHGPVVRRQVAFYLDLVAPESYLAAERVDRLFGDVTWIPIAPLVAPASASATAGRPAIEARARALRMPLVWPDAGRSSPRTTRIATLAAERGVLAAFALAIGRLAFCGGFDVDDPEILAEAAAAAGLDVDECLLAAGDGARDRAPLMAATALATRGAQRLPVLEVGRTLFAGEQRLPEALALARAPVAPSGRTG